MFGADIEDFPNVVGFEITGKGESLGLDYVDVIIVAGFRFVGGCENEVGIVTVLSPSFFE